MINQFFKPISKSKISLNQKDNIVDKPEKKCLD
jgi:hypothetical protein